MMKLVLTTLFKIVFKIFDLILYVSDIYSDIAMTVFLYDNCHFNYYYLSVACLVISYLTTVWYLAKLVHNPLNWFDAMFYPYHAIKIIMKKFFALIKTPDSGKPLPLLRFRKLMTCVQTFFT